MIIGQHPSHKTRFSDASTFDEICVYCGATDEVPGGWGRLAHPCPKAQRCDSDAPPPPPDVVRSGRERLTQ